jgi:hypothetical protein
VDENSTLSQIGFLLYRSGARTLPVALEQTCGPFPKWSIPNINSSMDRGARKVYVADITEPFTLALVRDVGEDFPLLICKLLSCLNFDYNTRYPQHLLLSMIARSQWAISLVHFWGKEQNGDFLSGYSRAVTKFRQSRVANFGKISRDLTPLLSSSS